MLEGRINKGNIIFIFLFIIFAISYYDGVWNKGPLGLHMWRQSDCLSITQHYAEGGSFFEPELHSLYADNYTSGHSIGEFPILYYIVGNVWKLTGRSHLVYRMFYLSILFLGLFSLFKMGSILLSSNFWSISVALILFTSPIFVFYGISFLTDAPALNLVLCAVYFLLRYHLTSKYKYFYVACGLVAIAGLIKVSSLLVFVYLIFILSLESLSIKTVNDKYFFHGRKREWFSFALVLLLVFGWYFYAHIYNNIHEYKYTFNSAYPFWKMNPEELIAWKKDIIEFASYFVFHRSILILLALLIITNIWFFRKLPLIAGFASIILTLGVALYFTLWAPLLRNHDYYYLPSLILVPATMLPALYYLKKYQIKWFNNLYLKIAVAAFIGFNFIYCISIMRLRTLAEEGGFPMISSNVVVEDALHANYMRRDRYRNLVYMQPYLSEIGVKRNDKVICVPDGSVSISLYHIQREGWTNYKPLKNPKDINLLINRGAKYLIVLSAEELNAPYLVGYLNNKIGEFNGIEIYKL